MKMMQQHNKRFYQVRLYMIIVEIEKSKRKHKRFRVILNDGKAYDFGLDNGNTYIDHKDKTKRLNYRKRHLGNEKEKMLISNLTPSPSLFSYYLLWGEYNDIMKNITHLNYLWSSKKTNPK